MLACKNDQSIPVNTSQIKADAQRVLKHLGYANFDLGILLADSKTMQEYNKKYRNKDKPTDILSFPFHADLHTGDQIVAKREEEKNLGDIIICPEYIQEDLGRWNQSFDERIQALLVHGICHLIGYDHIKDKDYEAMQVKEKELIFMLQKTSNS